MPILDFPQDLKQASLAAQPNPTPNSLLVLDTLQVVPYTHPTVLATEVSQEPPRAPSHHQNPDTTTDLDQQSLHPVIQFLSMELLVTLPLQNKRNLKSQAIINRKSLPILDTVNLA